MELDDNKIFKEEGREICPLWDNSKQSMYISVLEDETKQKRKHKIFKKHKAENFHARDHISNKLRKEGETKQ